MKRVLVLLFCLSLVGCATDSLNQEVIAHPDYDVTSYKKYRWAEPPVSVIGMLTGAENVQMELRVKDVVNRMLQSRGYELVDDKNAQIVVSTLVGAIEQTNVSQHVVDSQRYHSAQIRWTQENDYLRGAVSVIFTHPDTEDIVWQGTVGENLKNDANRVRGTIERFVQMIGETLPTAQS